MKDRLQPRDIRRRTITLFVLGILVPSSLLGYLAFRGIRNDQALLEREQREDLGAALQGIVSAHDSMLTGLGRSLAKVVASATGDGQLDRRDLEALRVRGPVEAVFRLSADAHVDRLVTSGLLYRSTVEGDGAPNPDSGHPALERARRREFQGTEPTDALALYRDVVRSDAPKGVRADALNAVARLERQRGNVGAAVESYRRLGSEFGDERTAGGIPFRLVARLELGAAVHQAGDPATAARTLLDLYATLLRGDARLTRAQYTFLEQQARERVAAAAAEVTAQQGQAALVDSLAELTSIEERARVRTERLLLFERSAGPALSSRMTGAVDRADPSTRFMLDLDGRAYAIQLDPEARGEADSTPASWGLLLDTDSLVARLRVALAERSAVARAGWSLVGASGTALPGSATEAGGLAAVSTGLPGGVPPLTVNLYPNPDDPGFVRTLMTSRRGIFLYAFLLLAGILVVGLVLTINTISHQLELSRMQSDFVSTVSHELRSPLTAIRQIGEMLQANQVPPERRRQYYDVLVEQSERLSQLMNRVLDFARLESGRQTLTMQSVDLNLLLENLVTDIEHRVTHEGFVVHREVERTLPPLSADPDALKLALGNLIDNAIKYSGESRQVIVRGALASGQVVVAVQDFGNGMDPTEHARVFERFYRGGDPLTRSVKGTGLGLAMVKHIVEGHAGTIEVDSAPGRGSTFTVRLPVQEANP